MRKWYIWMDFDEMRCTYVCEFIYEKKERKTEPKQNKAKKEAHTRTRAQTVLYYYYIYSFCLAHNHSFARSFAHISSTYFNLQVFFLSLHFFRLSCCCCCSWCRRHRRSFYKFIGWRILLFDIYIYILVAVFISLWHSIIPFIIQVLEMIIPFFVCVWS